MDSHRGRNPVTSPVRRQILMAIFPGALLLGSGMLTGGSMANAERLTVGVQAIQPLEIEHSLLSEPEEASQIDDVEADGPDGDVDVTDEDLPDADVEPLPRWAVGLQPRVQTSGLPWRYAELFATPGSRPDTPEETISTVPIVLDQKVERHIRFFNTAIRDRFEQWLTRLSHYQPLVERIFSEFDLPSDLVFLSLVESGFNPHAYSRARATGPWQFMKGTAKLYGLRVDAYVDERRDPIKSTVAAARYLRDLYDLFGTWPLAMAAYNAGEGKVLRALRKTQADSFSEIARTRHLRRETREYVPRFMAAAIIAKNPDRYGFSLEQPDIHEFEEVVVRRPVHLRDVATAAGISYHELRRLNPELRREVTPPDDAEYHLKVPVGAKDVVERTLDRVKPWTPMLLAGTKRGTGLKRALTESDGWYRVRVGDSLWTIAKRFRLSIQELKERNNLRGRLIKPGDRLAIGP